MSNNEINISTEKTDNFVQVNIDLFMKRSSKLCELSKKVQILVHDIEELELDIKQLFAEFGKNDT